MAGSRIHRFKSILKRTEGLLKADGMPWKERPVWYDVMKRFPPKVEPQVERPVPTETVRKILYPEDLIRAKFYEIFVDAGDVVNLKVDRKDLKPKSQMFVESYLEHRDPGMTVDEIIEAAEKDLNEKMKNKLIRKKQKFHVEPKPDISEVTDSNVDKPSKPSQRSTIFE